MARGRRKPLQRIILTGCYTCRWQMLDDAGEAPDPLPPPEGGEGMCPACMARCYAEGMAEAAEEWTVAPPACVNCHKPWDQHHRKGWCFWLSETDHVPISYSPTTRTVLQLVGDDGHPFGAPPIAGQENVHG
jgi:hypothetical protein